MWSGNWRDVIWAQLDRPWDLIVIGGGITGAGIFAEVTRAGLRALLLEAHDFASGTSSRSSKLVHGGLRYLKNAEFKLTWQSVKERELLLREGKGLIHRLEFLFTHLEEDAMPGWVFGFGLVFYDLLALHWNHRHYDVNALRDLCPPLTTPALWGGYRYFDALTDDARLVFRLIRESVARGGVALNYARVEQLLRNRGGKIHGVAVCDLAPNGGARTLEIQAQVVINATGPWTDVLRQQVGGQKKLRLLRGSHLILPVARLPLTRAISFLHPVDGRPVFAIPWEGVILMGTTDVEHDSPLKPDPAISDSEVDYLLEALTHVFPAQEITSEDVQGTFSGIRAVLDTGKVNPS